ncbi:D-aminoacyl-tRNA deacylase [Deinococcus koreensis]|uniref:D-aminoacyl-tRNA deacylase n=1 Tax=Deinococcus koreensis TaxID=2054903 RepID=A0A2K3V2X9_9DEIO|nr:D-aminoacyl-tRNA deacylase [Deinococcus koreensis]PNY83144.1 D-tyrosyl-tRNA(Tyr) deacylase [Deinococcus koreensis]
MKAVVQRVSRATCTVGGVVTGQTGPGLLVLLGVAPTDTPRTAEALAVKIARLRIFSDEAGRMNRSVQETGGGVLSISQFTLFADTRSGNRPSFIGAAPPEQARELYAAFNSSLRAQGLEVGEGVFGAHMVIDLSNDGPVTLTLEL